MPSKMPSDKDTGGSTARKFNYPGRLSLPRLNMLSSQSANRAIPEAISLGLGCFVRSLGLAIRYPF